MPQQKGGFEVIFERAHGDSYFGPCSKPIVHLPTRGEDGPECNIEEDEGV